jgi:phospholipid/cholesterol/gamma-HCH transport system substrate-binding protein
MRGHRIAPLIAGGVVLLLLVALVLVFTVGSTSTRTIKAEFATAPGIYRGNHVEVLGVPVGVINSVHATSGHVEVTMSVSSSVKVPANVGAYILAPQVVADRFVQLEPAYGGGPTMPAGGTIPVQRTAAPESVDAVIGTLNDLAKQLGPNGANSNGALTQLLQASANQLRGNGGNLHAAITNFSQALGAISQDSPQIKQLLDNFGTLSQALANNDSTYQAFTGRLADVSTYLANSGPDISNALQNLQAFFANLTTFIQDNSSSLNVSLKNLDTFAQVLSEQQANLAKVFDLSPLTLQNLDNAINKSAPGGPALVGRYDTLGNAPGLFNQVCGNTTVRFVVVLATGTETNPLTRATSTDTLCAVGNALNGLTPPPGSTAGPNLSLAALAAGGS